MPENLYTLLPFLVTKTNGQPSLNFARVIEAIIIAVIGAFVASYIAVAKIEVKLEFMQKEISKNTDRIERFHEK